MTHEQVLATIQDILEELRPAIMSHDGNVELIKYEDEIVYVKLHGACVACPISMMTLKFGVEEAIRAKIPELKEVIAVE